MCRLFETIRIVNGLPQHLSWHEIRMNHARNEIWAATRLPALAPEINVPAAFAKGIVRCNIVYGPDIEEVSYKHYEKRSIGSLKLVVCSSIDYPVKYTDRSVLDSLFALRGTCDEIIIVKNGLITDTSMSNIIFFDGTTWCTPAKPLLEGTCRNRLVAGGSLVECDIRPGDLHRFIGCKLINAMREPGEEDLIPVSQII
jgi:4-amino-4-deoxychorismate lyase